MPNYVFNLPRFVKDILEILLAIFFLSSTVTYIRSLCYCIKKQRCPPMYRICIFQLTKALCFISYYIICTVLTVSSAQCKSLRPHSWTRLDSPGPRFKPRTGGLEIGTLTTRPPHLLRPSHLLRTRSESRFESSSIWICIQIQGVKN